MRAARRWLLAAALGLVSALALAQTRPAASAGTTGSAASPAAATAGAGTARAIFAGGCFWCVEADFDKVPGVLATVSGYTGGTVPNPTYEQVSRKTTGHTEAVEITFDPARVSYAQLVEYFWRTIDPTVRDRQFCDVGSPYRTAIFALDEEQLRIARASLAALEKARPFKEPVVTPVLPAAPFYPAEEYHQDYYRRNPVRYDYYRSACGRDARLRALWGEQAGKFPGK
ncbi:MAG: peptide-methionine (S)-S-oxide reductase MsrA [Betaproteobacteria bacterium]|nr:peptide-methionine (S)-S-oxide reductase MsrA [Betaproteobacteria bacterium]